MAKIRVGNKQNSYLNGEWAGHVRKDGKKITSGKRRLKDKEEIKKQLKEINNLKISISENEKQFLTYQEYLIRKISEMYGIPSEIIKRQKETRWQKIKRNVKLLVYKIGEKFKRRKKGKNFTKESWSEAMKWVLINEKIKEFRK